MNFVDFDKYIQNSKNRMDFMKLSIKSYHNKEISELLEKAINLQTILIALRDFTDECKAAVEKGELTFSETIEVKYLIDRIDSAREKAALQSPFNPQTLLEVLTELFSDLQTPTAEELDLMLSSSSGIAFEASRFFKNLSELI